MVVVGLSIAYSFNASRIVLDSGKAEAETNIKQISELLNLTAAQYASTGGLPVLEDFFDGMFVNNHENHLLYIVILSDDGKQLLKAGKVPVPLPEPDSNIHEAVTRGTVHVRNYILLRGNRVGTLNFGVSTQHVLETLQTIQRQGLIISGGITVLVLAGILATGFTVSRRISRLIEASQQIADGRYDIVRADESGKDEISNLASNFNVMADGISRHIREVQEKPARGRGIQRKVGRYGRTSHTAIRGKK